MLATMWLTLLALICVINNVNVATAREELESKIEIKLCDGKDGGECKGELVAAEDEEKALEQLKSKHGDTVKKWFSVEAKDGAEPPHCGGAQITVFSNLDLLALCKTVCEKALEQITNACPDVYLLLGNNKQTETEKQEETQEQPADTVAPDDNPGTETQQQDGQVTETVDTSQSQGDIDAADGTANATATADAAAELDTTLPADGETQDDPANTTATAAAVPPKADAASNGDETDQQKTAKAAESQEDSSEEKEKETERKGKGSQTKGTPAGHQQGKEEKDPEQQKSD